MQRCNALVAPLTRQLRRGAAQIQPSRSFFIRKKSFPPALWDSSATLEQHFRDMARQFDRLEREMESQWRRGFPMASSLGFPRTSAPMSMYESEVDGKYQMNVVMGEKFTPENIKVTLKDRILTIEAKYDHSSEDGKSRVYQEFSRQFTLPDNVNPAEVKSMFTADGVLQIEAPLPPEPEANKPKEIPINFESSKK